MHYKCIQLKIMKLNFVLFCSVCLHLAFYRIGSALDNNAGTIKVSAVGFNTERSDSILQSLLARSPASVEGGDLHDLKVFATSESRSVASDGNNTDSAQQPQIQKQKPLVAAFKHPQNYSSSDASFVFLDNVDLLNENTVLERFQESFRALLGNGRKSPLIIVFTGIASAAEHVEYLLKEAWLLLDKDEVNETGGRMLKRDANLFGMFDVQIILTPFNLREGETINPRAVEAVDEALLSVPSSQLRELSEFLPEVGEDGVVVGSAAPMDTSSSSSSSSIRANPRKTRGIEATQAGVAEAVDWAMSAANASIARLNAMEPPEHFAGYIENLVRSAQQVLRQQHRHYASSTSSTSSSKDASGDATGVVMSPSVLAIADQDLAAKIFSRMLPFYKRQIQLLRNAAANRFNEQVSEEVEVSINILEDLQEIRDLTLRNFSQCVRRLTPRGAPRSRWSADFEVFELAQTLDEYLAGREAFYRLSGVLSRGIRAPIDVSFHVLALHPLGLRDYRQDALGYTYRPRADQVLYDAALASEQQQQQQGAASPAAAKRAIAAARTAAAKGGARAIPPTMVSAAEARTKLQRKVTTIEQAHKQSPPTGLGVLAARAELRASRQDSEFAREMLMFPLSVKNPGVPMAAGRSGSRKASSGGAPKKNTQRMVLGPERFVRWDLDPLSEVKLNLDKAVMKAAEKQKKSRRQGGSGSVDSMIDEALNVLPQFNEGYYKHPAVNYGPAYEPPPPLPPRRSHARARAAQATSN